MLAKQGGKPCEPYEWWPVLCCVLITLGLRMWLLVHAGGVINGEEALVGIQAQHILRGERPVYYSGQPYMGSLEAYLIALLFALVGSSVRVLRAEPVLLSLVLVWLTCKFAAALAIDLPVAARRSFVFIAGLCAAVAPLYDTVQALRVLGGYIEALVLILLLLLSMLSLTRRWKQGAGPIELAWRCAGFGLIAGLGLWVNPLFIVALLTAVIWFGGYFALPLYRGLHFPTRNVALASSFGSARAHLGGLLISLAALPGAVVGAAPALYWGATHQWENVTYVLHRGGGLSLSVMINRVVPLYTTCVAPRVIGGALPREDAFLFLLHTLPLILGLISMLVTTMLVVVSFFHPHPILLHIRRLTALPLLFAACSALFFWTSSGPFPCDLDLTGRYAIPLMLALPFLIAIPFVALDLWRAMYTEGEQGNVWRWQGAVPPLCTWLLLLLLCLSLGTQALSYGLSNAGRIFQSPYCTTAPTDNESLIAYLQREGIRAVWANIWIAYPIDFKTDSTIIASDPRSLMPGVHWADRLPDYIEAVRRAPQASMILFVPSDEQHPEALTRLDAEHITYRATRFPSSPGQDLLVITPLNRPFLPYTSMEFFSWFVCTR